VVREDVLDLFGFISDEELRFFELLLTVSGIGPKSALGILDTASIETIQSAVINNNPSYLTSVSGIGKKTAEKIVMGLKDKMNIESLGDVAVFKADVEALEAMRSLGYSAQEARDALREVPQTVLGSNDRLREALRLLGSKHT
jgi:Holliday junction DNA helicase RuvA